MEENLGVHYGAWEYEIYSLLLLMWSQLSNRLWAHQSVDYMVNMQKCLIAPLFQLFSPYISPFEISCKPLRLEMQVVPYSELVKPLPGIR